VSRMPVNRQHTTIHIERDGPYRISYDPRRLDHVSELRDSTNYGVYQIYGGHPVYGNSALLYIGMAEAQGFGKRIVQ
jgi:hypothetical protein